MDFETAKQNKNQTRTNWVRENVLSSEQRKELIMNKVKRAQAELIRHRLIERREIED